MCRNRPEATRNGISSETPYRLCGGGQIVTMDDKAHYIDAWDLLIAHPPCTYLSNAGARHLWKGHQLQEDRVMKGILGRDLFMRFWWADIPRICVENPVPSRVFCLPEYTQIIQPYQFGHPYSKKTCLWLKNLDRSRRRTLLSRLQRGAHLALIPTNMMKKTRGCLRETEREIAQRHSRESLEHLQSNLEDSYETD